MTHEVIQRAIRDLKKALYKPSRPEPEFLANFTPEITPVVQPALPSVAPVPAPARKGKRKILTPEQRRMSRIRSLLASLPARPDLESYGRLLDQANILPPQSCRRVGCATYEASLKKADLRRRISAEISNACAALKPRN